MKRKHEKTRCSAFCGAFRWNPADFPAEAQNRALKNVLEAL